MEQEKTAAPSQEKPAVPVDLTELAGQTKENTDAILKLTKKIHRYMIWQRVFNVIKLIIILAPIIWAAIYIPRLLNNPEELFQNAWLDTYIDNFAESAVENIDLNQVDINQLAPEVRQRLK